MFQHFFDQCAAASRAHTVHTARVASRAHGSGAVITLEACTRYASRGESRSVCFAALGAAGP